MTAGSASNGRPSCTNPPAGRGLGCRVRGDLREEPVQHEPPHVRGGEVDGDRPAHQLPPPSRHRDGGRVRVRRRQQRLLRRPAGVPEGDGLPRVRRGPLRRQQAGGVVGEGEVHVVPAHQQVPADGDAVEGQFPALVRDGDQREVCRPAAHVDHQQHVAGGEVAPPVVPAVGEVGVDRRLRFLQQHRAGGEPGVGGGFAGEVAGGGVEARRHRQRHRLLGERGVGVRVIPRRGEVSQQSGGGLDRADLGNLRRRVPRQDRRPPVHARVPEPRLGGPDDPVGNFGGPAAGVLAGGEARSFVPRQRAEIAAAAGEEQEARQRLPALHHPRGDQLRHREHRRRPVAVGRCQYAVRRPQVHADRPHHPTSTSAGAIRRTASSSAGPVRAGRFTVVAVQPAWTSTPGPAVAAPDGRHPAGGLRGGVEAGPLLRVDGRLRGEQPVEHLAGVPVHVPHGGPDLGVVVAGQVFLQEIDQPGLPLQRRQQNERVLPRGPLRFRRFLLDPRGGGRRRRRLRFRVRGRSLRRRRPSGRPQHRQRPHDRVDPVRPGPVGVPVGDAGDQRRRHADQRESFEDVRTHRRLPSGERGASAP